MTKSQKFDSRMGATKVLRVFQAWYRQKLLHFCLMSRFPRVKRKLQPGGSELNMFVSFKKMRAYRFDSSYGAQPGSLSLIFAFLIY